jgi:glucokinase
MKGRWAAGIDVGGTKIEAAAVDAGGMAGSAIRTATDVAAGPKGVTAAIVEAVRALTDQAGTPPAGVGVGIAGQIDASTGSVRFAPNLGWHDVPLAAGIKAALGVAVIVTNDVRAAAFGEWRHGAGRGYDDLVCVYVGTGIGGGIVSGGRMLAGCANTAGEIGHIVVEADGPPCTCGGRGCLEALAGGWAIGKAARTAIEEGVEGSGSLLAAAGGAVERVSAEAVAKAAAAGDALALHLLEKAGRALAAGCVSLVNAFNPCRLILGGGVIDGVPGLIYRVRDGVSRYALPAAAASVEVVAADLGRVAGVVGAGTLALEMAEGKP